MAENTAEQMDNLLDAEGRRRRKDRPVVEKKRHPLETVPFFDRPMGASIKDVQVGEDDIGNPVFKTKLGDTYTVRLNPDQRTTRTKIEEDVLPAVKQYLQDPQLPTKEQVVGAGKAVAGAIKETVSTPKKLLTGEKSAADVTMGDVFDTAGMMAIGSAPFKVPEDSLRLFGGINIKGATERKNLNKAVKLLDKSDWTHKSGPVPYNLNKKIWEKTGWYVDPTDGQWRIHIDDSDSILKSFEDAFKIESGQVTFKELGEYPLPKDQSKKVKLAEILDHKNLYTRYPDLKDLDVNFYSDIKKRETLGSADGEKIYINLAAFEKYGDMKSTILHEIQHIIQDKEGFVPGSSTAKIPNELVENKVQEIKQKKTPLNVKKAVAEKKLEDLIAKRDKEAEQLYKKISTKDFDSVDEELLPQLEKDIRDTKSELTKTIEDLYELDKEAFDLEFQFYRGAGGEIESRLVQKMADDSVGEFPIGVRSSMLKEEGQNFQYRGSQGVDPFQYTPTERRNPEKLRPFHLDFLKRNRTSSSSEAPKDVFTKKPFKLEDMSNPDFDWGKLNLTDSQVSKLADVQKNYLKSGGGQKAVEAAEKKVQDAIDARIPAITESLKYKLKTSDKGVVSLDDYKDAVEATVRFDTVEEAAESISNQRGILNKMGPSVMDDMLYDDIVSGAFEQLPDNETFRYILDEGLDKDLVDWAIKEDAIRKSYNKYFKVDNKSKEFAEGGVAMKDQMEMAFMQEGGLKDDGMDIDPVSGNEVPPGSMAREVRDDIPAQLSEGEYVVPADVVQYYGVKFFEDLRMDAKRGLADMEANGRIGGEPVDMPMDMPMDDTPTVAVSTGGYIDGIPAAEYNVGGMASNLYNNPTQMDQEVNNIISTMYNNPQVMDELARRGIQVNRTQAQMMPQQMNQANPPSQARMGMNPGGLTSNEAAAYNYITSPTIPGPMFQTPGASYIYAAPPQMTTTAAGVDSSVPSVENCNKMGMDYDPIAKICVPREVTQAPQTGGGDDDDGGPKLPTPDPDAWMENYDYTDMDALAKQTGDAIAGGSNLPGLFGTFDKGVTMAHSAGHIILLQAQGKTEEAERLKQEWDKARTGALKLTPLEMIDGDRFAIQAAGAHGIELDRDMVSPIDGKPLFRNDRDYERYRANYDISVKDKKVTPTPTKEDKTPTPKTPAETAASLRKRQSEADSPSQMRAFQKAADIAQKAADTGKSIAEVGREIAPSDEKKDPDYGDPRRGMMAKGGLMKKKKKK